MIELEHDQQMNMQNQLDVMKSIMKKVKSREDDLSRWSKVGYD